VAYYRIVVFVMTCVLAYGIHSYNAYANDKHMLELKVVSTVVRNIHNACNYGGKFRIGDAEYICIPKQAF